jgi:hypothetical protein
MGGKWGATGARERSEHAPGVTRFSVHCIGVLGLKYFEKIWLRGIFGEGFGKWLTNNLEGMVFSSR